MTNAVRYAAAGLLAGVLVAPAARAQRAPAYIAMFGGDALHTGRVAARGPRREPHIAWRVRTGRRVFASPAVDRHGWAVFGSLDGGIHAVDAMGVERWAHLGTDRVFSSPAILGDVTVVGNDGDAFVAFDPRGRVLWQVPVPEDADSPALVGPDGTFYVASRGVSAVGADGRVRWNANVPGHVFGAPALGPDGTLYVPELSGGVSLVGARDGRVIRRVALPAPVHGGVLVLEGGVFVVGTDDGHVRAFAGDGTVRWDVATEGAARGLGVRTTPALARDGTVVFGGDDGGIYGVRANDGAIAFRAATAGAVRSSVRVDADGWMYVGSEDDRVYGLDPHGTVVWSVPLGGDVDSSPAILRDGLLVVGCDDGGLYALEG